ncbi:MAG: hypothetical protein LBC91_06425 [Candidatus Accumulibacter sp.]|jgi:uncharacterized membrane protein|nr:hypothetical protein [Accumulibacter sp.]
MSSFPIPAPAFDGRSRAVEAGAVFAWLRLAWNLFMADPGVWIIGVALLIAGFCVLMIVPLLGPLLAYLLAPIPAAGLLALCRKAADGERPRFSDLAVGLTRRTTPLILLGAISALALLAIHGVLLLLCGGSVIGGLLIRGGAGIGLLFGGPLAALLFSSLLFIPLWMALWFAPALVLFDGMSPLDACKTSFGACLKNIPPLLILALIALVLSFLAAVPAGLGFLILIPVLAGTAYASWQDVFVAH